MNQNNSTEESLKEILQHSEYAKKFDPNDFVTLHSKVVELIDTLHQELQKAREQRKGWKGYLVVDPETDNYTYSDVYLNRIDAEKWLKANGISGLKIIEVDVYQSDLDQPTV